VKGIKKKKHKGIFLISWFLIESKQKL